MKTFIVIALSLFSLLLVAFGAITIIDRYMSFDRMWETPAVKPHEEELLIMEEGVVPTSGGEAILRASKGEELRSPLQAGDPDVIEEGKAQYFLYCAQCHGRYHDGNGTVGQSFHPLPTDLRSERVQSLPEGVIFKEISYGIPKPDNRQPPLATTIDIMDRWRIVSYLKSLGPRK